MKGEARRMFLVPGEGRLSGGSGTQDGKGLLCCRKTHALGVGEMKGLPLQLSQMS